MLLIEKKFINNDLTVGKVAIIQDVIKNTQKREVLDMILMCDTKDSIVFCTKEEVNKALKDLPINFTEEFNRIFAINEDIHDCIEEGHLMLNITMNILTLLEIPYLKHFNDLEEYCELFLAEEYAKEKKRKSLKKFKKRELTKQGVKHER